MDGISCKTTPCSLVHTLRAQHISNSSAQGIQKTKFIFHQYLIHIDMEQQGMVEWSTDTQTSTTLFGRCMTIDGPQRICP